MRWAVLWAAALAWACGTAGAVPGGGADGGSGSRGSTGDAGPADSGPADGGADAGADAGYSGADCRGVVPAATGAAYTFQIPASSAWACVAATSDGQGVVAAEQHADAGAAPQSGDAVFWAEVSATGSGGNSFTGSYDLIPQPSGFLGTQVSKTGQQYLASWDQYGNMGNFALIGSAQNLAVVVRPQGPGAIALRDDGTNLIVSTFDAKANPTGSASFPGAYTVRGGAQDASGSVLALVSGSGNQVDGVWIGIAPATISGTFPIGSASSSVAARALAGGGVVVRLDGAWWTGLLIPGEPGPHAAPAWVLDSTDFSIVRGGKAYAAVQAGSNVIGLVSSLGNSCGAVTMEGVSSVAIGVDGTVIGGSGPQGCTKVFWPALLK